MDNNGSGEIEIEGITRIEDLSTDTLFLLIQRLETSTTGDHLIFREAEMDDAWRHADADVILAERDMLDQQDIDRLAWVRDLIFEAHDLVGDGQPLEAAAKIRELMRPPTKP